MLEITDERYLPYIKAAAYSVLSDGQLHDLMSEVSAKLGTIADHLCQFRCEKEGRTYSDIKLCREHGRRLLIQDAIDELQPKLKSEVVDRVRQYRLATVISSNHSGRSLAS